MREFVALDIQHATRTRHIAICGLSDLPYFVTLSQKRHDFRGENLLNTKCVIIDKHQHMHFTFNNILV